ncbi:L-serine ammonia-lyase, iron-sulfur-dependent, subunit alpha [Shigella flexneri]
MNASHRASAGSQCHWFSYKMNASDSGAEVGCQVKLVWRAQWPAAGLAELLGASPAQVCIAAEIAMEHNLGLTRDLGPAGQVQVRRHRA